MNLSDEEVSRFDAEGFLIVERIISDAHVDRILEAMNRVYGGIYNRDVRPPALRNPITPHTKAERSVRWILHARLIDADLWDLATDPVLGHAAARLLQTSSVSIIEDQLLDKPGPGIPVALHQDYSYWPFSTSTNIVSCWIALSDMTPAMGPVEVIPGSHRWGVSAKPKEFINGSDKEYLSAARDLLPNGIELRCAPTIVPKGGGVFFHGLTLHGSRRNSTDQPRRALTLHWAASDCRFDSSTLAGYGYPYLFAGLRPGDRLVNKYLPQVYPRVLG